MTRNQIMSSTLLLMSMAFIIGAEAKDPQGSYGLICLSLALSAPILAELWFESK
jgi:hypothetical protein